MNEVDFRLPLRRNGRRPALAFGLTVEEVAVLQKLADGSVSRLKEMARGRTNESYFYNTAYRIRIKMGAVSNENAVAIGFREGLIT